MNNSSVPREGQNYDIVPADDNLQQYTNQDAPPEIVRLGMDGSLILSKIIADYQALRDIEETKRIEIEARYRERMVSYSRELDILVREMQEQSESQKHYIDKVFALANRMLDEGSPELSVHVYELFINDSKRKNLMEYLIEYHERITLGKIKLQNESTNGI
jgi:hypothetical protein